MRKAIKVVHLRTITTIAWQCLRSAWLTRILHKIDAFVNKHWNIRSGLADRIQRLSEVREIVDFFLPTFEKLVDFFFVLSLFLLYSFQAFLVFSRLLLFLLSLFKSFTFLAGRLLSGRRPRLRNKTKVDLSKAERSYLFDVEMRCDYLLARWFQVCQQTSA